MLTRALRRPAARIAAASVALALVVAGVAVVGAAGGSSGRYVTYSADSQLWATVNVCHGHRNPPTMGVRARMPADNARENLNMRFYAQFKQSGKWHALQHSSWQSLGSGPFMWQEAGWNFKFTQPGSAKSFLMRGMVKFRWKQNGQVVRSAKRYTSGGHPTGGSHSFSAAHCRIYGPPASPHS